MHTQPFHGVIGNKKNRKKQFPSVNSPWSSQIAMNKSCGIKSTFMRNMARFCHLTSWYWRKESHTFCIYWFGIRNWSEMYLLLCLTGTRNKLWQTIANTVMSLVLGLCKGIFNFYAWKFKSKTPIWCMDNFGFVFFFVG